MSAAIVKARSVALVLHADPKGDRAFHLQLLKDEGHRRAEATEHVCHIAAMAYEEGARLAVERLLEHSLGWYEAVRASVRCTPTYTEIRGFLIGELDAHELIACRVAFACVRTNNRIDARREERRFATGVAMSAAIDQAISDLNNARQILGAMLEDTSEEFAGMAVRRDDIVRACVRLSSVFGNLMAARNDDAIIDPLASHLAALEKSRLESQDELRGAQLEIERLQRYADAVTERNSDLMKEKETQQRVLEQLAADLALGVEVATGVFREVCKVRDAARPSTRLFVPHSVTTLEHHEQPREAAGVAR